MAPKKKIEKYAGNRVKLLIQCKAVEKDDHSVWNQLYDQIKMELGISSNKLSYLINNNSEMLLRAVWIISQVLEVDLNELVRVNDGNNIRKEPANQNVYDRRNN